MPTKASADTAIGMTQLFQKFQLDDFGCLCLSVFVALETKLKGQRHSPKSLNVIGSTV